MLLGHIVFVTLSGILELPAKQIAVSVACQEFGMSNY